MWCLFKRQGLGKTLKNNQKIKSELSKPVIFLGMMGCGKSYVSRLLADRYGLEHYEMDEMIETAQGMSVPEVFEKYGETHFRLLETELLVGLLQNNGPCVISSGGGVVGRPENLEAIKDLATSIWLKVDMPVLLERVRSGEGRPMLLQDDNPAEALEVLLVKREDLYAQADIHIKNNGEEDIDVLTDRIIAAIIAQNDKENG